MAVRGLSQDEADILLKMQKTRIDEIIREFPQPGDGCSLGLVGVDGREHFTLDLYRGRINLAKTNYQNRARGIIMLVRVDLDGTHRNPDGTIITGAHIHLYREGYGDRWAWRLHEVVADFRISVQDGYKDFCDFCNITKPPKLQMGLF